MPLDDRSLKNEPKFRLNPFKGNFLPKKEAIFIIVKIY